MAVSISCKNNDHLQRNANNCLNSILCVPFADNNITGRKISDEDIHKLAHTEGKDAKQENDNCLKLQDGQPRIINYPARPIIPHELGNTSVAHCEEINFCQKASRVFFSSFLCWLCCTLTKREASKGNSFVCLVFYI